MLCSNNIHSQIILDTALENIGNHQNSNQSKFTFNIKKNPTKNITNTIIITKTKNIFSLFTVRSSRRKGEKRKEKKIEWIGWLLWRRKAPPLSTSQVWSNFREDVGSWPLKQKQTRISSTVESDSPLKHLTREARYVHSIREALSKNKLSRRALIYIDSTTNGDH